MRRARAAAHGNPGKTTYALSLPTLLKAASCRQSVFFTAFYLLMMRTLTAFAIMPHCLAAQFSPFCGSCNSCRPSDDGVLEYMSEPTFLQPLTASKAEPFANRSGVCFVLDANLFLRDRWSRGLKRKCLIRLLFLPFFFADAVQPRLSDTALG